jgi:hypothetical protein
VEAEKAFLYHVVGIAAIAQQRPGNAKGETHVALDERLEGGLVCARLCFAHNRALPPVVCGGQVHAPLDSLAKTKEDGGVFEYFFWGSGIGNSGQGTGNSEQQIPPLRSLRSG